VAYALENRSLEEAFDRIEQTILPTLSTMLDMLIESASLARAGADAEAHAAQLRGLALELDSVTSQVEALSAPVCPAYLAARISA
jgi:hypothetical protein